MSAIYAVYQVDLHTETMAIGTLSIEDVSRDAQTMPPDRCFGLDRLQLAKKIREFSLLPFGSAPMVVG